MAIEKDRLDNRFSWSKKGELVAGKGISVPDALKPIVANAPSGDQAIGKYLLDLVADQTITLDDVAFLIDSGAIEAE